MSAVPLAVSGPLVISVVVLAALGLLFYLLRAEREYEEDPPEPPPEPGPPPRVPPP